MKVTLHIGAHRTGTTTFQAALRQNATALTGQGIGVWGPLRTRKGLFAGILPMPGVGAHAARRARGRILLQLDRAMQRGIQSVLVSDENMIGTPRRNLRAGALYPDVGERLARYAAAFDGQIDRVVLSVRSLDHYWASAAAYCAGRGHPVTGPLKTAQIAGDARSWRDVITDVACAVPQAETIVVPFERSAGRIDLLSHACLDRGLPDAPLRPWLNRSPRAEDLRALLEERGEDPAMITPETGRWTPFDPAAQAALREAYADDLHWLVAGADGLATLTEDLDQTRAGHTLPHGLLTRGQGHDKQERRMAEPGGG